MHPTAIFTNESKEQALAFAAAYPFAMLAVNAEQGPITALVPLVYNIKTAQFLGHVARANPFWQAAQKAGKAVAVFRGVDAYVSPSSYPSKAEHHKAVPTWNYTALEVRGDIKADANARSMEPYLAPLTDVMESQRETPWKITDAPEDYIAKLSKAIVGLRLSAEDFHFVEKLSQNKSHADRAGVIADLQRSKRASDNSVAAAMQARN